MNIGKLCIAAPVGTIDVLDDDKLVGALDYMIEAQAIERVGEWSWTTDDDGSLVASVIAIDPTPVKWP